MHSFTININRRHPIMFVNNIIFTWFAYIKVKINKYCGDMDNYYLNNAVYLMEDFLESTNDPYYNGEVDYGDRAEHCWNGDHSRPNATSRLRYHQMFIKKAVERIEISAPEGADLKSWRY